MTSLTATPTPVPWSAPAAGDHRMAHAAAVTGLAVPGVRLSDVACTAKTQPEFPALWTTMVARD